MLRIFIVGLLLVGLVLVHQAAKADPTHGSTPAGIGDGAGDADGIGGFGPS